MSKVSILDINSKTHARIGMELLSGEGHSFLALGNECQTGGELSPDKHHHNTCVTFYPQVQYTMKVPLN